MSLQVTQELLCDICGARICDPVVQWLGCSPEFPRYEVQQLRRQWTWNHKDLCAECATPLAEAFRAVIKERMTE